MPKCCYCDKLITKQEIEEGEAHKLMGILSHKSCDEVELAKIDKNMKIVSKPDIFAED